MCEKEKIFFFAPEKELCVDNATMIAWAGLEMISNGEKGSKVNLSPKPRWRLDKI